MIGTSVIADVIKILSDVKWSEIGKWFSEMFGGMVFDGDKMVGELEPIYITLIAPRGSGKTSLLSTIVKYMQDKVNDAVGIEVKPCKEEDAQRMDKFQEQLVTFIKAKKFEFTSAGDPSAEINKFEFEIDFTRIPNAVIKQKFVVMDIPGGIINDSRQNAEFEEHLEKSRILWIPVEAIALMEGLDGSAKVQAGRENVLCTYLMSDRLKKWAKKRLNFKGVPCSANFVMMKSESYFSHRDNDSQPFQVSERFDREYGKTVSDVHLINQDVDMSYVPVETIGVIKKYQSDWIEQDGKTVLKCVYQFDSNAIGADIKGVDRLMYNVLDYCNVSLSAKLDKVQADIDKKVAEMDKMSFIAKMTNQKAIDAAKDLQKKVHALADGLQPLKDKLAELKSPTDFSRKFSKML